MIVEVLVTQSQGKDSLLEQLFDRVLDQFRIAVVVETLGQAGQQPGLGLQFPEQQGTTIGRDRPAVERGRHLPPAQGMKIE